MPRMRVLRPFPFGGQNLKPGTVDEFPECSCRTMERGSPPFGERVNEDAPESEPETTPTDDE